MMRISCLAIFAALAVHPGQVQAQTAQPSGCLTDSEIREEVQAKRVVPQLTALRAARAKMGGEAVRARLCREGDNLFYHITALRRDGRVVRVVVDAATGKVLGPQ